MILKLRALVSGLATYIPGYQPMRATGGTDSARYCYSVWLRHMVLREAAGRSNGIAQTVAELGPGDSIGIGLAALLSGVERYYALDVVRYSNLRASLGVFDELVELFRRRAAIPDDDEFPHLQPRLDDYAFPHHLLGDSLLDSALAADRVRDIRASIEDTDGERSRISYCAPWADAAVIQTGSVDLIYSQAVLEHVTDIPSVYRAMRRWLKPTGVMSHQIDYRCHGKADTWNGHWGYSDAAWKIIVGRRPYLLNRVPHSEHMRQLREAGFDILSERPVRSPSKLRRGQLARRYRELSDADLTTSGAFIVAAAAGQGGQRR